VKRQSAFLQNLTLVGARGALGFRIALAFLAVFYSLPIDAATSVPSSTGQRLYREGVLPSGAVLLGIRDNGVPLQGAAAACANCHRRSGLGSYEGTTTVPPIIGRYLFRTRQTNVSDLNLPHVRGFTPNREAYTNATLATAIRTGTALGGRTLSYLMPRYDLDAASMAILIDYLQHLGAEPVPGVSDSQLDFATVVTPDADPIATEAMLSVMERFFAVQNEVIASETRPLKTDREFMYRVTRRWRLHIWRLAGAPETWDGQLKARISAEPVFAVISGIGGRNWQPVHAFCEERALPCLLPNVDLPIVAEQDFYSVYWSRGVLLEADLMGQSLAKDVVVPVSRSRIVQVFRTDDIGGAGAAALRSRLASGGREPVDQMLSGDSREIGRKAFAGLRPGDSLVLWLRNADLAALPTELPRDVEVFASGLMAGLEGATPPASWRARLHLAYPFDLPDLRRVRINFPLGWMRLQKLPVVNERIQSDTYIACQILAEALGSMLDSFVREFLVERVESMLSTRLETGYYPRLGLAPGQRFASKGGYLVHFAASSGTQVIAEGDWTTP
jgi:hypothetical protein